MTWTKSQQQAIDKTGGNLLVSASAGSGKTAVIVESILQKIILGTSVDRIVLLTFTNAAAGEMKERLTEALVKECSLRKGEERARLIDERDKLGFADIGTIDSYCVSLVKKYSHVLGFSPSLSIIDDKENDKYRKKVLDKIFQQKLEEDDLSFRAVYNMYHESRSDNALKEKIFALEKFITSHADEQSFVQKIIDPANALFSGTEKERLCLEYASSLLDENSAIEELDRYVFLFEQSADSQGKENAETVKAILQKSAYISDLYEKCDYLSANPLPRSPSTKKEEFKELRASYSAFKSDLNDNGIKKFKDFLFNLRDSEQYVKDAFEQMTELVKIALLYIDELREEKRKDDKMTFSDLQHYSVKILSDQAIAEEIKSQYDYVFIDEYQDVNEAQNYVVSGISNGNLITVGDIKQSIYKFRLSEPKIFSDRYDLYSRTTEGENIFFNENFRSAFGVLDFVNGFFSPIMTKDLGGTDYKSDAVLIQGNKDIFVDDKCVFLRFFDAKPKSEKHFPALYSVKEAELISESDDEYKCNVLFEEIKKLVGKKVTVDGKEKELSFKDITVLIRAKSSLPAIFKLEEKGIKLDLSGVKSMLDYPETGFILSVFRLLQNDMQDDALVKTMLSPLGRFDQNELAQIALATVQDKNKFFFERVANYKDAFSDEKSEKIKALFDRLERYRLYAVENRPGDLAEKILTESNYRAYLSSEARSTERASALTFLINQLNGFDSISDFVDFYQNGDDTSMSFVSPPSDENSVKICTMHQSKGLQFPAVIIFDFDKKFNPSDSTKGKAFLTDPDWGIAGPFFDNDKKTFSVTAMQEAFSVKKKKESCEEELRLLYVAMTRAKYYLTIVAQRQDSPYEKRAFATNPMQWLYYSANRDVRVKALLNDAEQNMTNVEEAEKQGMHVPYSPQEADERTVYSITSAVEYVYPFSDSTKHASKYSVTELVKLNEPEENVEYMYESDENLAPKNLKKQDYIEAGITLHAIMQNIPLDTRKEDLDEVLKELVEENIVSAENMQKVSAEQVWKCLSSETICNISKAKVLREQSFLLCLPAKEILKGTTSEEKVVLQGVIDLLSIGEKVVLVDYKASKKSSDALRLTYAPQLKLYALAVEKILGRKVDKAVVYNFYTGKETVIVI